MRGKPYKLGKIMVSEYFMENWYFAGFDAAMQKMLTTIRNDSSRYDFSPDCLNNLGYCFIDRNRLNDAIKIFEFAVELHPENDNLWDSLGEAYMKAGNRAQAIKNYRKALELNPDLETAKCALQILEKE
jgi:tetratricopeptide (TPR) repeat protein